MQSQAPTVAKYLAELPADRRAAIEAVRAVIRKNLDAEFAEGMQYGMISYHVPHAVYPPGYHCDPKQPLPFICLASQKNYLSLYLGCVYGPGREEPFRAAWAKTGKKLDMGKTCVRFKKIEDLALDVIADAIRGTTARKFIAYYESVIKDHMRSQRQKSGKKPARAKAKTSRSAAAKRKTP